MNKNKYEKQKGILRLINFKIMLESRNIKLILTSPQQDLSVPTS